MNKKQAKAAREAWRQALAEGRVIRVGNADSFKSYPSSEDAEAALRVLKEAGVKAVILRVPRDKQ